MAHGNTPSYSEILKEIEAEIKNTPEDEAKVKFCEQLAMLRFEISNIKQKQKVGAVALRHQGGTARPGVSDALQQMPPFAEVDMRDALDALDGFYALEYNSEGPYRWTGPGATVKFRVWVDRSVPVQMDAMLLSFGDERNRGEITLRVDGIEIGLHCGDRVIRSDAFPTTTAVGMTEIIFNIPHLFSPQEKGEDDTRSLGVAFRSLRLSPV